jgi:hypothetical protein
MYIDGGGMRPMPEQPAEHQGFVTAEDMQEGIRFGKLTLGLGGVLVGGYESFIGHTIEKPISLSALVFGGALAVQSAISINRASRN